MSRARHAGVLSIITAVAVALTGCGGTAPEVPRPDAEAPDAEALDDVGACLVAHSPWTLDLGRLLEEHVDFLTTSMPEAQPAEWDARGVAQMVFTDESRIWQFTADDVTFTIAVDTGDGVIRTESYQVEEQNGEFSVVDGGFLQVDAVASLTHVDEITTTLPNGEVIGMTPIGAPPVFPWSRAIVTGQTSVTYGVTCSPSELVLDSAGVYGYHFVPGS